MRARIVGGDGKMYHGEIYGTWNNILGEWTGWRKVTESCFTRLGVKVQLKKWKQKQGLEEFDI